MSENMLGLEDNAQMDRPEKAAPFFVGVHIGVGYHSEKHHGQKRRAMVRACKAARDCLQLGGDGLGAVVAAIRVLEDCPFTNAGLGSNLTIDGAVEADASVMTGDGRFAAIGAAPGLHNPIEVAASLAVNSQQPLSCGRVQPIFLAGDAARRWALQRSLPASNSPEDAQMLHVTDLSVRKWKEYHQMINSTDDLGGVDTGFILGKKGSSQELEGIDPMIQKKRRIGDVNDTVGCVVIDQEGTVYSGVSSGGIAMKTSGRVGEAAVYGAGCWAFGSNDGRTPSVGASASGVGEVIMRSQVAQDCCKEAENKSTDALDSIVKETILKATSLPSPAHDVGILCVRVAKAENGELTVECSVGHNSHSMGFGCLGHNFKALVEFLPQNSDSLSQPVALFGMSLRWMLDKKHDQST